MEWVKIEIPKQLHRDSIRFIKLRDGKIPLEVEWSTKNNYSYNDTELLNWIKDGNNYGVVTGNGLIVIDADKIELKDTVEENLPETFAIKTGSGHHFYYYCDIKEKIIYTGKNEHWGELQTTGQQVVGPGCLHVKTGRTYEIYKDVPIAEVNPEQIMFVLRNFVKEEIFAKAEIKREHKDIDLRIVDICDTGGLTRHGNELQGAHPIHGSSGGSNFCINELDNIWHCFRCNSGGGVLQWIAVQEGIINCADAQRGCLTGELFRRTLKVAKDKYGLKTSLSNLSLKDANESLNDYLQLAEKFIDIQPLYYDDNKTWWIWNIDLSKWKETDDVNILNKIDESIDTTSRTTKADVKNEIMEALKRKARLNTPLKIDTTWVQFKDKLVDISTGDEIEACSKYFSTNPLPWKLGKSEDTPILDGFLKEWVGEEHVPALYEYIAFAIVPDYFINRFFFFIGGGNNGKSTLFNIMTKFLGKDNVVSAEMDDLLSSRFQAYKLYKKLACFMGETDFGMLKKTAVLKKLTGKDLISFEKKHAHPFDDINYAKIYVATNTVPDTADKTIGWYRRFIDLSFPNDFEGKEIDVLSMIPDEEYENLCLKCLNICKRLIKNRRFTYEEPSSRKALRYEARANPLLKFISETCEKDNYNGKIPFFEFYDRFIAYLYEKKHRAMTKNEVSRRLKDNGYDTTRGNYSFDGSYDYKVVTFVTGLKWKNTAKIVSFSPIASTPTFSSIIEKKVGSVAIEENDEAKYPENGEKPASKSIIGLNKIKNDATDATED